MKSPLLRVPPPGNEPPTDDLPEYLGEAASSTLEGLRAGDYIALMGPHSAGKTEVLDYVRYQLQTSNWLCLTVDLSDLQALSEADFFVALAAAISRQLSARQLPAVALDPYLSSGRAFSNFLKEEVAALDCDLVLLIDNLEALPNDLIQALLRSLRTVHQSQAHDPCRLLVTVAGAIGLGALTLGPTSPFNIARRVFVGDLSWEQDIALMTQELAGLGLQASEATRNRLRQAAAGDPGLMRLICRRCSDAVKARRGREGIRTKTLRIPTVERVVRDFLAKDAANHKPLKDGIDLVEDDADLLQCLLPLLNTEEVCRRDLLHALSSDHDPLYLTGLVRFDQDKYRFRNQIYRTCLLQHFTPGRVGHLLTMAGRWDEAIDYLAASMRAGHKQHRIDLLDAAINSMRAAPDAQRAAHFLARGLVDGFGLAKVCVWQALSFESKLKLLWCELKGARNGDSPEIPLHADRLEARAFREACTLGGPIDAGQRQRAFPLLAGRGGPIGVVAVIEPLSGVPQAARHDADLELQGYLVQAARALDDVMRRHEQEDRGRRLAETLREIAVNLHESLNPQKAYDVILQQMALVLPFDTASIQLPAEEGLHLVAGYGFKDSSILNEVFPLDDCYPNVRVYRTGSPLRYDAIQEAFPHFADPRYQAQKVQGWLGVPLLIGAETLGVITLDSFTRGRYTQEDAQVATIFASMAALAIRNAGLYQVINDDLQRRIARMKAVEEIDVAISSTLELQHILSLVLSRTLQHTKAACGAVQLLDSSGTWLVFARTQGVTRGSVGEELPLGHGVSGLAALHKETCRVADLTAAEWAAVHVPYRAGMRSALAVPMEFEGQVVGVIDLESDQVNAFSQDDQEFVELLATQAAIAIHNALRYHELEHTKSWLAASQAVAWLGLLGADWQHTINQKTFSIDLYTSGLRDEVARYPVDPGLAAKVEKALNGIERVVQVIRTVRFTSQVPAETSGEVVETTLLDDELADMVERWTGEHPDVQVQYSLACPGLHAAIPPKWLEVAMEKLVHNAIKAMPDGGQLTVTTRRAGQQAWITIKDTGHGIPESARKTFLKDLSRRTNGDSGGTGLGALIARFVVLSHGGELSLVDTDSWGTELRMVLPLAGEASPSAEPHCEGGQP